MSLAVFTLWPELFCPHIQETGLTTHEEACSLTKILSCVAFKAPSFFLLSLLMLSLAFLVKEGYEDRIVIAHDIHTKNRLTKYGGHGYSHILKNIVPKMLMRGISQHQVDKILIDNPKSWLTFK